MVRASRSALLVSSMSLAACGAGDVNRAVTVVYASGADLQSINPLVTVHPLAKAVQKHVLFMTLAVYDSLLRPIPRLAESWEWNADRTMLTFTLRDDVFWHDGVRTTARDVLTTVRFARDPATGYPRARDFDPVVSVNAPDSLRVEIRFSVTQPVFPDVLTDLAILPAHYVAEVAPSAMRRAAFNEEPVGNGPFRFVDHRPNQRWVFERNVSFPVDFAVPPIDRFVIVVVDEATTKLAALTTGELDFAGISPGHAEFVRKNPRLRIVDFPILFSYGVFWNLRRRPFDDHGVRRALTMAIDRRAIIDGYLYGFGTPATGPVAPSHPWYVDAPGPTFDPGEARRLLDSLGWRVGENGVRAKGDTTLSFVLLTVGSGDLGLEQMLQEQMRSIGVTVTLRQLELSTFLATARGEARDYDALLTGISGDLSLGYVDALFGGHEGPLAYAGYRNRAFDEAVARARTAETETQVADAWADAQRILAADFPVAWVYHARGVQGVTNRITNTQPDLRGELGNIHEWRFGSGGTH